MLRKNRILDTLDAMPARCRELVRCCGFVEKNIWRKTVAIHNIFKEKSIKLNSQPV